MASITYGVKDLTRSTGAIGHGYVGVNVNMTTGSFQLHGGPGPRHSIPDFVLSNLGKDVGISVKLRDGDTYISGFEAAEVQTLAIGIPDDVARDIGLNILNDSRDAFARNTATGEGAAVCGIFTAKSNMV